MAARIVPLLNSYRKVLVWWKFGMEQAFKNACDSWFAELGRRLRTRAKAKLVSELSEAIEAAKLVSGRTSPRPPHAPRYLPTSTQCPQVCPRHLPTATPCPWVPPHGHPVSPGTSPRPPSVPRYLPSRPVPSHPIPSRPVVIFRSHFGSRRPLLRWRCAALACLLP